MTYPKIRKAVFPAAGLGTRFLPATKSIPKEMLCLVDKPLIQYGVEEAVAAGCTEIIIVTGRDKAAMEDHFDSSPELEYTLEAKNKQALLDAVRSVSKLAKIIYTRQSQPLGLGHAVPYFLQTSNDALIVVILLNVWIGIPFNYLVIQSGLQGIPSSLHEAALIDGAGWWRELTRITIPLLRETLLTVLMLGIMGTMNVFAFVWILTQGGPADATMLPGPLAYTEAFVDFNYGQGAAIILGVVVILLCIAGMFLLATRSKSRQKRRAGALRIRNNPQEVGA